MYTSEFLVQQTYSGVELFNQRIDFRHLTLDAGPVIWVVPLRYDLIVSLALLLDPSEVFEVVNPPAILLREFQHVIRAFT